MLETPVRCRLPVGLENSAQWPKVRKTLSYEDGSAKFQWGKWRSAQRAVEKGRKHWFVEKFGREALDAKVRELDAVRFKSVVFQDDGGWWTLSGLAPRLADMLGEPIVQKYFVPKPIPGARIPERMHRPRPYQEEAADAPMISRVPGLAAEELATGLGKSTIIGMILSRYDARSLVLAPTLSIAGQLYKDFCLWFGEKNVGRFYDGYKEPTKKFVVAVSASVLRMKAGTSVSVALLDREVLVGDESHMLPADSLVGIVAGVLAHIPLRFFCSGTQIRNDGADILLEGLVGPILMRMSLRDGVNAKWLSEPSFVQWSAMAPGRIVSGDVISLVRKYLHDSELINQHAASLANQAARAQRRVLILIKELEQVTTLLRFGLDPRLTSVAHGGVDNARADAMDLAIPYRKSDPSTLVDAFDAGKIPILVGTGCIGMGTDIKSTDFVLDLVGNSSEPRLRQAIGRGVRLFPGKTSFWYHDYTISNVPVLANQGVERARIFKEVWASPTERRIQ